MSTEKGPASSAVHWDDAPDLLTPAECAALLRAGRTSTYEAIRCGPLRPIAVKWGSRKYLIPKAALRRLVEGGDSS